MKNLILVISINSAGLVIEFIYVTIYMVYAKGAAKVRALNRTRHNLEMGGHGCLFGCDASSFTGTWFSSMYGFCVTGIRKEYTSTRMYRPGTVCSEL